jgi:hypothetical protein
MITKIKIQDVHTFDEATRVLYGDQLCRIFSAKHGAWWCLEGRGYTIRPEEAWLTDMFAAISAIGIVDATDDIYLEFLSDIQDRGQVVLSSPSKAYPKRPHMAGSNHTQEPIPRKGGTGIQLYAVILPAVDLLSGTEDTSHIVLELSAAQFGFGVRKPQINWHGPYATEQQARDFVSQLATQPPTAPLAPAAN